MYSPHQIPYAKVVENCINQCWNLRIGDSLDAESNKNIIMQSTQQKSIKSNINGAAGQQKIYPGHKIVMIYRHRDFLRIHTYIKTQTSSLFIEV